MAKNVEIVMNLLFLLTAPHKKIFIFFPVEFLFPVHVVDARLIFDFMKLNTIPVSLTLNVRNLFDYYYVEVPGNLGQTRQVTVQIDAKL